MLVLKRSRNCEGRGFGASSYSHSKKAELVVAVEEGPEVQAMTAMMARGNMGQSSPMG